MTLAPGVVRDLLRDGTKDPSLERLAINTSSSLPVRYNDTDLHLICAKHRVYAADSRSKCFRCQGRVA